ncbi:MAG TPA: hypothetical protein VGB66_10890, partial [Longimicrobium sp.]
MSMISVRRLAMVPLAAVLAACDGGRGGAGEKGAGGDSAQTAKGDSAAPAQPQATRSPRGKAPPIIRGLYVNAYKAGSG